MAQAFKFIHASDFHLDCPMRGLAELPVHLKSILANSPYESARKVFDLAISERVDFVLLSGDLFDISASGPRPAAFLLSQFERLAVKGIEVYWCSGAVDPIDRWPSSIEFPDNVTTFSTSVLEDVNHRRDGKNDRQYLRHRLRRESNVGSRFSDRFRRCFFDRARSR